MNKYLVISAIGQDRPGIVKDLSEIIYQHGGNILESRMAVLGEEFALLLLLTGHEKAIGEIVSQSEELEKRLLRILVIVNTHSG